MIGEHVNVNGKDFAVFGRSDRSGHVVIASERGRHQVLTAIFHPLHRLARDDGADDRENVARVDADLVTKAATDVGADDPDLVLGQTGHHRVDGAVRMWCLTGRVHRELTGHLV